MNLALSLRAKGSGGLIARTGTIAARFGVSSARADGQLSRFFALMEAAGARPTFPITAAVLARHRALVRRYAERGVEFAVHGLVHNDHAVASLAAQRASIGRAVAIFRAAGVPCSGFRGPYLRANAATDQAVREAGLDYHSSQAVNFCALTPAMLRGPRAAAYARALALYGAHDADHVAVRPRATHGLISIPVAVPDDEILVDRLHLSAAQQSAVWRAILHTTHERGDLFTLQLHPERIDDCASALEGVLREARAYPDAVWIATLDEIARWWRARADARIELEPLPDGWTAATLSGDCRATLRLRGAGGQTKARTWAAVGGVGPCRVEVGGGVEPSVGVAADVSLRVRRFLREEGFVPVPSAAPSAHGAYLDASLNDATEADILRRVTSGPGPLVRLERWPNGARSALAVTGDIDCLTLQDFALRVWETRPSAHEIHAGAPTPVRSY